MLAMQEDNTDELFTSDKGTISEPDKSLLNKLINRCQEVDIKTELRISDDNHYLFFIYLPCGREKRELLIMDSEEAKNLAKIEFEKYAFVLGYQSICSYEYGTIEAYVRFLTRRFMPRTLILERLFMTLLGLSYDEVNKKKKEELVFITKHEPPDKEPITIAISQPTNTILTLTQREMREGAGLTIKISGLKFTKNERAVNFLEKFANPLLFQIDSLIRYPLMLETYYERPLPSRPKIMPRKRPEKAAVTFPKYEYDRDPLNLYWYARSAFEMPLLRFLAYYQVLEFYFPTYSSKETSRVVANILKDPNFVAERDVDISKVISAVLRGMGKGYAEEKQQLCSTILGCVEEKEIRDFIEGDDHIKKHLKTDFKKLSSIKVNVDAKDLDIRAQIAERLYDIRCKIVHAKAGNTVTDRILPFSKEESLLAPEITIIEFIARKAIIAGSKKLTI